jgi:hypothetical protein
MDGERDAARQQGDSKRFFDIKQSDSLTSANVKVSKEVMASILVLELGDFKACFSD